MSLLPKPDKSHKTARGRAHRLIWVCAFLWALVTPGLSYQYIESGGGTGSHVEQRPAPGFAARAESAHTPKIKKIEAKSGGSSAKPSSGTTGGSGIGGTGNRPKNGDGEGEGNGIGGTGQRADTEDPNGIGGTGIIGAITGFGSIYVNGFEVDIPASTPIHLKDRQTTADRLKIGQVVSIEAKGKGKHVSALNVRVRHEVGGSIEKISRRRRTIRVLGQTVKIGRTRRGKSSTHGVRFKKLRVGKRVDVSGFRRADGTIEATRIDPLAKGEPDHLIGQLEKRSDDGLTVSGVEVTAGEVVNTSDLVPGTDVRVVGTSRDGRLRARAVHKRRLNPFSSFVRHLAIEGYARRSGSGAFLLGHYPLAELMGAKIGQRVIFNGRLDRGRRFIPSGVGASRLLKRRGRINRILRQNLKRGAPLGLRSPLLKRKPGLRKKRFKRKRKRRFKRPF